MVVDLNLTFLDSVTSTIEFVDIEKLSVDPRIQRPKDANKIRRIYKRFTPSGVGTLLVSRRPDGTIVILDGQTRHEVLLRKLKEDGPTQVKCEVFEDLTEAQEAALFLTHNYGSKPRATDNYRISGVAGNEVVLGIDEILKNRGYKVSPIPGKGHITAVGALERIYRTSVKRGREPNTLDLALIVINRAFGFDPVSTKGVVLEGVAAVLEEYGDKVDVAELVEKMREIPDGATGLLGEADSWRRIQGMRPSMAMAAVLVFKYNEGKRSERRRLPEWRRRGYATTRS